MSTATPAAPRARRSLTVTKGKTIEHVRALVVGSTGYINGNETALHNVIGLTTKQAHTYAGKWLSFPTSNTALATLVQGLLTSQVPDELQMGGPFTYGPATTVDGERALAVHGFVSTDSGSKIDVVLYVPASGSPLPIEELTNPGAKTSSDIHGSVAFSKWGEKTAETAPGSSMSLLKLTPAQTSGATLDHVDDLDHVDHRTGLTCRPASRRSAATSRLSASTPS